jgi:hypothetical protein
VYPSSVFIPVSFKYRCVFCVAYHINSITRNSSESSNIIKKIYFASV